MFEAASRPVAHIQTPARERSRRVEAPVLGPTRALGLVGGFYLLQFVTATVVGALAGLSFVLQRSELGANASTNLIGIVGPLGSLVGFGFAGMATFCMARRHAWVGPDAPPWARLAWKLPVVQVTQYALGGALLGLLYLNAVTPSLDAAGGDGGLMAQMSSSPGWPRLAWALLALLLAPWIEEFIFRGLLYGAISERVGALRAGTWVAVLFSIAHLPETLHFPPAILAIAALAVTLSVARWRSGGLLAPVAIHCGYNAVIVGAAMWWS